MARCTPSLSHAASALVCAVFLFAAPRVVFAYGWGINTHSGWQGERLEEVDGGDKVDIASVALGFGAAFDTALAMDRTFNYRVELNFERLAGEEDADPETYGFTGVGVNQTLGFAFYRSPRFRIFAGPAVRFGIHRTTKGRYDGFRGDFGGGLDLGINFHLSDRFTLSGLVGYQALLAYWERDEDQREDGDRGKYGYQGLHHRLAFGLAVYYRSLDDQF